MKKIYILACTCIAFTATNPCVSQEPHALILQNQTGDTLHLQSLRKKTQKDEIQFPASIPPQTTITLHYDDTPVRGFREIAFTYADLATHNHCELNMSEYLYYGEYKHQYRILDAGTDLDCNLEMASDERTGTTLYLKFTKKIGS